MLIILHSVSTEVRVRATETVRVSVDRLSFHRRPLPHAKLVLGVMATFVVVLKINILFPAKRIVFIYFEITKCNSCSRVFYQKKKEVYYVFCIIFKRNIYKIG
uniref:Uncharacterized protein n=1 Tax=Brassica oleracea var. oleracea TaxID=109376 RepID=A0A0D3CQY0_BRAOL